MSLAIDYDERNRQWQHAKAVRARLMTAKRKPTRPAAARLYAGPIGPERPAFALSAVGYAVLYAWPIGPVAETEMARARRLLREVADAHGFTINDLLSERRENRLVKARHEAMTRVYEATRWSLPRIGRFFGGRDHTTVLHAIRKFGHCPPRGAK